MLIISFAWTTAALLADAKHCTRRSWNDSYARRFRTGMEVQGWDRGPRVGGRQIAIVKLTCAPYLQRTCDMTEYDYQAEGLLWMGQKGIKIRGMEPREFFENWKDADELVYVTRLDIKLNGLGLRTSQ